MKIQFWAVGKNHEQYVAAGVVDFTRRASNYFPVSWRIFSTPKNASGLSQQESRKKEGEAILKILDKDDFLILLDEKGMGFSSTQLADFIQVRANKSTKQLIFLIGGAFGADEAVIKRANHIWSLSALTFPHQLVRLVLAEQVYRACTILRNEKYHHS